MSEPSWYAPLQLLRHFAEQPDTAKAANAAAKAYLETLGPNEPATPSPEPAPVPAPAPAPRGKQRIECAEQVKEAQRLIATGMSIDSAAQFVGLSYATLSRRLREETNSPAKKKTKRKHRGAPRPMPRSATGKFASKPE